MSMFFDWITDMQLLNKLEEYEDSTNVLDKISETKLLGKHKLAYISDTMGINVDPMSMFDVQVKRIHEYKRLYISITSYISVFTY